MARRPAYFEYCDEFEAFLPENGVVKTADDYVWWMNAISTQLGRRIGPSDLTGEEDVQRLLAEVRALDDKSSGKRLLTNPGSENNLQSILRKYAQMVNSNFRGLFTKMSAQTAPAKVNSATEQALHDELLANYDRAGRETGYWGNYFLRELRKKGGLATAKRMLKPLNTHDVTPGLQALIDAGRIDLSVEATVLKPEYRALFTSAEISEAQRRLDNLPAYVRRHPVPPESNFPDDLGGDAEFTEGGRRKVMVNAYERNPAARAACLAKYGTRCAVCGISFEEQYGPIGKGFIHVHHKKPLAARRGEYKLDPKKDLAPVCPNCHAMLHTQDPPLGIDELKTILAQHQKNPPPDRSARCITSGE